MIFSEAGYKLNIIASSPFKRREGMWGDKTKNLSLLFCFLSSL